MKKEKFDLEYHLQKAKEHYARIDPKSGKSYGEIHNENMSRMGRGPRESQEIYHDQDGRKNS